jgi:hypothetical protein
MVPARGTVQHFAVDDVVVGHGLVPATEITRLMRVEHAYDAAGDSGGAGGQAAPKGGPRDDGTSLGAGGSDRGRCRGLPLRGCTRAEIDLAVQSGAVNLNQLKAWTRCGMGHCQRRMCADAAAALLAVNGIARQDAGQFTGRTPLRPVPLDLPTGDYVYADIVLPPAAPP